MTGPRLVPEPGVPDRVALRRGALAALREGRVSVLSSHLPRWRGGIVRPSAVVAQVQGHESVHEVELAAGLWSCSCGRRVCSHVVAVRMVTRHVPDLEREFGL